MFQRKKFKKLLSADWKTWIKGEINMAVTRAWKVYGLPGHRQRESFFESVKYDFSVVGDVRIIELENSDKTGTNEYTIIRITRNTSAEAESELWGQLHDGAFENSDIGMIEEIEC